MNVHPSVGENPAGPTTADPVAPEVLYELKIDTNGDAVADIGYRVRFSSSEGGAQTATLRSVEGAQAASVDPSINRSDARNIAVVRKPQLLSLV